MADYTANKKISGLDALTDVTLAQSDLHIIGDTSDSGKAKSITHNLLEDYIANSDNFIDELTTNTTFITNIITDGDVIPLTTKGDILTHDGNTAVRKGIGTNGYVPIADSAETVGWRWGAQSGGGGGGGGTLYASDATATLPKTIAVPANTLGTGNIIRVTVWGYTDLITASNQCELTLTYGASSIPEIGIQQGASNPNFTGYTKWVFEIQADGTTSQIMRGMSFAQSNSTSSNNSSYILGETSSFTGSEDSTTDLDIVITDTGTIAITSVSIFAELIALPNASHANGTFTKDASDASTTQTIPHGLGVAPSRVRMKAIANYTDGASKQHLLVSEATYNGTVQDGISYCVGVGDSRVIFEYFRLNDTQNNAYQEGAITVDATNINISWGKTNSAGGSYTILWEAEI